MSEMGFFMPVAGISVWKMYPAATRLVSSLLSNSTQTDFLLTFETCSLRTKLMLRKVNMRTFVRLHAAASKNTKGLIQLFLHMADVVPNTLICKIGGLPLYVEFTTLNILQ